MEAFGITHHLSNRGFSLIESVIAVLLMTGVSLIVVELLHKNTVNLVSTRQSRKAAALADMVLEKYDYLATVQFNVLDQLNQTNATAASFFATGQDNQGYDGLFITTVADPPGSDGSRCLTVTISWTAQAPNQRLTMTKYLQPGTGLQGGAPVHVVVVDPSGAGVPGFEVRAAHHYIPSYLNSIGTNEVIGFTDLNGMVTLNNVATDPALQPMSVYARKVGSDAAVAKADPAFVQGYYVPPNNTWNTKTLSVIQTSANNITFDMRNQDFIALAGIRGTLTNVAGPNTDMDITMIANAASGSDGQIDIQNAWDTGTDAAGRYEFNNVAPGPLELDVDGHLGSDPTVAPGAGFDQGYSGFGGNGGDPRIYQTAMAAPPLDIIDYALKARPLGSLNLTTADFAGNLIPGATVSFTWPDIGRDGGAYAWSGPTDSTGRLRLYNLFAGDNEMTAFSATVAPNGCANIGGYVHNVNVGCSASADNPVALSLNVASFIQGTLTDNATPGNALANMLVSVPGLDGNPLYALSAADGSYTLCGISPDKTYIPNWPKVTFTFADQSSRRVQGTFSGTAVDNNFTSQGLPGVQIIPATTLPTAYVHNVACAADPNPTNALSDAIVTDGAGNYGPVCAYIPFQTTVAKTVIGGPPAWSAGTIALSTSTMKEGLAVRSDFYNAKNTNVTVTNGSTTTSFTLKATLIGQMVSGTVHDASTGSALTGLAFDPCSGCSSPATTSCPVTTDSAGQYGPVQACISGRSSSNPGTLSVAIPDGLQATNTGKIYAGYMQSVSIPSPASPAVPLSVNFSLGWKGGGL